VKEVAETGSVLRGGGAWLGAVLNVESEKFVIKMCTYEEAAF
jgi:hypothetical protein